MARPKLTIQPITVSLKLTLHPDIDDDLIAFFENLPKRGRAKAVMVALRQGVGGLVESQETAVGNEPDSNDDDMEDALLDMLF